MSFVIDPTGFQDPVGVLQAHEQVVVEALAMQPVLENVIPTSSAFYGDRFVGRNFRASRQVHVSGNSFSTRML